MSKSFFIALICGLALYGCALRPSAELSTDFSVRNVYSSHMVLQRDMPIKLCGKAEPGKAVRVELDQDVAYGVADADGNWLAELPARDAGGPYTVTVSGNDRKVVFDDVLIGEVWLCCGQSNMEMKVMNSANAAEEIANADHPQIRLFNGTSRKSVSPLAERSELTGDLTWEVCSPKSVPTFSAAGYFFGRQLQQDLNVPVGLVSESWGGTDIVPWISKSGYVASGRDKELRQIEFLNNMNPQELKKSVSNCIASGVGKMSRWLNRIDREYAAEIAASKSWSSPDFDDSAWESGKTFPHGIDGAMWFRCTVDLPESMAGSDLKLVLNEIDDCDCAYFNGEAVGETNAFDERFWLVKRVYPVPGKLVKPGKNVIAVRVMDQTGNGGLFGKELALVAGNGEKIQLDNWKNKLEFALDTDKVGGRPVDDIWMTGISIDSMQLPTTLFNAMLAPWLNYPMRGAIWYQGCNNVGRAQDYAQLHRILVNDWRNRWGNPDMAFCFVQLSALENHDPARQLTENFWEKREPGASAWAELREAQTSVLTLPRTGMAVAIDVGMPYDIHPVNKQAVGYRLAQEAERICYGKTAITSGPSFSAVEFRDGKAILTFDHIGGGLKVDGDKLNCFAVAGADGKFYWADAVVEGDKVVVSSDKVATPAAVRYAWENYPGLPNLYNAEGFPAVPFRTDTPEYMKQYAK